MPQVSMNDQQQAVQQHYQRSCFSRCGLGKYTFPVLCCFMWIHVVLTNTGFFPHQSCWLSNNLQLHNKLLGIYMFEKGGSWIDSDIIPQWQKNHGSFLPTDWCFRGPWEFREEISLARAACEAIKVQTVWKPKRPMKCPCCRRHRCVC